MSKSRVVHLRLEGRVQGVNFRGWAREQAELLGLSGWIKNRRDGAVEALFAGDADNVGRMLELSWSGPRDAHVENIQIIQEGGAAPEGFSIKPTT